MVLSKMVVLVLVVTLLMCRHFGLKSFDLSRVRNYVAFLLSTEKSNNLSNGWLPTQQSSLFSTALSAVSFFCCYMSLLCECCSLYIFTSIWYKLYRYICFFCVRVCISNIYIPYIPRTIFGILVYRTYNLRYTSIPNFECP